MLKSETKQHKCMHHWIIDSPNGNTSHGKCRNCGVVTEFSNVWISGFVRGKVKAIESETETDSLQALHPD